MRSSSKENKMKARSGKSKATFHLSSLELAKKKEKKKRRSVFPFTYKSYFFHTKCVSRVHE